MASVKCGKCKKTHSSVQQVKACYQGEVRARVETYHRVDAKKAVASRLSFNRDRNLMKDLMREARDVVVMSQMASVPMIQRKFRLGWIQACHVLSILEEEGVVSPVSEEGFRTVGGFRTVLIR